MKYDVLNPSRDRYTIEAYGRDADLFAAGACVLLSDGYFGIRRYQQGGEAAVVIPPLSLTRSETEEDEVEMGKKLSAWWRAFKRPGMPGDFFEWLKLPDTKRGVADALDSVELEGDRVNFAVDLKSEAARLAKELRSVIEKRGEGEGAY